VLPADKLKALERLVNESECPVSANDLSALPRSSAHSRAGEQGAMNSGKPFFTMLFGAIGSLVAAVQVFAK
jgi:hypothetical protein